MNEDAPSSDEDLAFLPVTHLASLIETRQLKPSELTKLYLSRLKRYDPRLFCVVNLTEELAMTQARGGLLTAVEQGPEQSTRPIEIRSAHFTPAVQFIQANRFRTRVMEQMDEAMSGLDLFIGSQQSLTNRTGHPVVSLPSGFHGGLPTALHFTGKIFGDSEILRLAHAFQAVTGHHRRRPPL